MPVPAHFKALAAGDYTFGIRAADVSLAPKGMPFMVELAEISGSETYLHVKNGEQTIVGLLDMVRDFTAGEKVKLALDSGKMYAFGTDGALVSSPFGKGK